MKKVINTPTLKVFLPPLILLILMTVVMAGGKSYHPTTTEAADKFSVDSIRARNSILLMRIEEKTKSYELTHRHN